MGVMKDLALELELYWEMAPVGWSRELPGGRTITISSYQRGRTGGYKLTVERKTVADVETLAEAIVAAGSIAREQLANQARTWARDLQIRSQVCCRRVF